MADSNQSPIPLQDAVDHSRKEAIQKQPKAAPQPHDDFVTPAFHLLDNPPGDLVGRQAFRFGPRKSFVFEERVEVFTFCRAWHGKQHIDSESRKLRPDRFAEPMQGEFAGRSIRFYAGTPRSPRIEPMLTISGSALRGATVSLRE